VEKAALDNGRVSVRTDLFQARPVALCLLIFFHISNVENILGARNCIHLIDELGKDVKANISRQGRGQCAN